MDNTPDEEVIIEEKDTEMAHKLQELKGHCVTEPKTVASLFEKSGVASRVSTA